MAVSGASNVIGTCNDLAAISRIVHRYGARLHVDAAQLVAHRPVDMARDGIDSLAFSAHKLYAPFGSGALIARRELLGFPPAQLARLQAGGDENVVGIAALAKAIHLVERSGFPAIIAEEQALTALALRQLATIPGIQLYGVTDPDAPRFAHRGGVLAFALRQQPYNLTAQRLAECGGIGLRTGCFCAHILVKQLMGIAPWRESLAESRARRRPTLYRLGAPRRDPRQPGAGQRRGRRRAPGRDAPRRRRRADVASASLPRLQP